MTLLTKEVRRETHVTAREAGHFRAIIVILKPNGTIGFKAKGCKSTYDFPIDKMYSIAAKAHAAAVIAKRVAAARSEMAHVGEFDYVTINDNFDVALQDIAAIFRAERLVGSIQMQRHAGLIKTLT